MRFKVFLCMVALCLAVCSSVVAGNMPALQQISEHTYAQVDTKDATPAGSFGSNAGLVVGRDAALVIDTFISAKEADGFLANIRKVTDKPLKYVVNTHHHLDHTWGNCVFAKLGAVVIAQENALAHKSEDAHTFAHPKAQGLTRKDLEGTTLQDPTITFKDSMKIDLGGVTVELTYPGPTHTDDSILVYVVQDKVLFTGDILFTHYHPYVADGDIPRWQQVVGELEQSPATKIIPGHGPVSSKADLEAMKTYLREFDTQAKALCAGKAANDAPAVAKELIARLPQQQRIELPVLVEFNLRLKYLPRPQTKE